MGKGIRSLPSMPTPPVETESFLASLLWSQTCDCKCASCKCLRDMGKKMMDRHIKE